MSEAVEPVTPTILPAKSEDKLEIEKEEIEKEEEKKEETKGDEDTKVETEEVKEDKEKKEESTEKKDEGGAEKTEDEPEEGEENKKFKLPKIKTPKVIKELRSKSKERKKKKEEEKQNEDEKADEDTKKEEEGDEKKEDDKEVEGDEKKESEEIKEDEEKKESDDAKEGEEKKDETKDTKTKIKDAIDNIHMPKFHKPSFMKKKEETEDKAEEKVEGESTDKKEENEKEEKEENTEDKKEKGETEQSKETDEAKPEETKDAKSKVKEALDNIHMPKMPKLHKPSFMKKKPEVASTSEEKEKTTEEPVKKDAEKADTEETKEADKESTAKEDEEKDEKTDEEQAKPDKKSIMNLMTAKLSKPAFLKKKKDSEEEKEVKETDDAKPEDEKKEEFDTLELRNRVITETLSPKDEGWNKNEKEETSEKEDKDEEDDGKNEDEKADEKEKSDEKEDETKKSDKKEEESKKSTIMDSLRSIKAPKLFSNKKEKITNEETDESKELLDKKDDEEETVEDGKDLVTVENEKTDTPSKASTLLQTIRSAASGVPALFKKGKDKEVDVEAGESQELLEKKDSTDAQDSNKINEEELVEIKLDDGTEKKDPDSKSQGSEKKDPEKSDEEKDTLCRVKNAPSEACSGFQALDQQKKYGICGIILGIILLLLIIVIACAATPGNWYNSNRMVEGGKYIETITSCGTIQGLVDGEDRYSFTGIPYSVPMTDEYRFTHSRLPATLAECPNGTFLAHAVNTTKSPGSCWRSLPGGVTGDEDCLTLDVFTSNVVYNEQLPVVVYVSGEGLDIEEEQKLRPTSALAQQKMTVFVTVSIRTGVLGFLSHPALARDEYHSSSGNYGLGDLVTALKWINVNIHHFGGHPGKVTVMGHQFGATVVTALTGTPAAEGLFSKIWVTSGAGKFSNRTAEEVQADNDKILKNLNCGEDKLKCLMDADPKELVKAVPEAWNTATKMGLPSDSEEPQHSWIANDNFLYTGTPFSGETNIPIVIGAPAQTDATSDGYMYMPNWNETDQYESMVESSLASFGDNLFPRTAMNQYNMSNNWKEYTSMVSDIRTICPLELLAQQATKLNSDGVFFYVAETPRSASQLGGVADASSDIAAIFGLFDPQNFHEEKFVENMQSMFYTFVKRGMLPGNTLVGEGIYEVCHKISYTKEYKTCKFWKDTEWNIVPGFAKI